MLNPLDHPICFQHPTYLSSYSEWLGHIPFGMLLVDLLRPKVIVELGVQLGLSYCGFCQAVNYLSLDTKCFGIDTWEGDAHTGAYESKVLETLRKFHDPAYGKFSTLVQNTFDNAVSQFVDQTIDLLHIDGYHTYEAVKHDYETWKDKVAPGGMILFHDTNVRQQDFGVFRFWEEIRGDFPHFEFLHSRGLGVLANGIPASPELAAFLTATPEDTTRIRNFFERLGYVIVLSSRDEDQFRVPFLEQKLSLFDTQNRELADMNNSLAEQNQVLGEQNHILYQDSLELRQIQRGIIWKLILLERKLLQLMFPAGSKREALGKKIRRTIFPR
jgi:O-antigen biosynthesis protein